MVENISHMREGCVVAVRVGACLRETNLLDATCKLVGVERQNNKSGYLVQRVLAVKLCIRNTLERQNIMNVSHTLVALHVSRLLVSVAWCRIRVR